MTVQNAQHDPDPAHPSDPDSAECLRVARTDPQSVKLPDTHTAVAVHA